MISLPIALVVVLLEAGYLNKALGSLYCCHCCFPLVHVPKGGPMPLLWRAILMQDTNHRSCCLCCYRSQKGSKPVLIHSFLKINIPNEMEMNPSPPPYIGHSEVEPAMQSRKSRRDIMPCITMYILLQAPNCSSRHIPSLQNQKQLSTMRSTPETGRSYIRAPMQPGNRTLSSALCILLQCPWYLAVCICS